VGGPFVKEEGICPKCSNLKLGTGGCDFSEFKREGFARKKWPTGDVKPGKGTGRIAEGRKKRDLETGGNKSIQME